MVRRSAWFGDPHGSEIRMIWRSAWFRTRTYVSRCRQATHWNANDPLSLLAMSIESESVNFCNTCHTAAPPKIFQTHPILFFCDFENGQKVFFEIESRDEKPSVASVASVASTNLYRVSTVKQWGCSTCISIKGECIHLSTLGVVAEKASGGVVAVFAQG
jgi:hypothetical protein